MNEEELIEAIADHADQKESDHITTWKHEITTRECYGQQEDRGRSNPESRERHRIEDVGGVLHDHEVDPPDHGHHEEEDIGQTKRWMRRRDRWRALCCGVSHRRKLAGAGAARLL